jgi:iron(III) transport system permease protein
MDPALEEASTVAGAGIVTTLRQITARILRPSILAALIYILVSAMESFEIPGVIGLRAGIHVLALKIYLAREQSPPDYGMISTLAVSLLLISAFFVFLYGRATSQAEKFATITGKGYRPQVINLGAWRYAALGLFIVYFLFTVILPFFILVWASLLPFYSVPSAKALASLTLDNYNAVFNYPRVGLALRNTFLLMLIAPTITMALCSILSWFIVKGHARGSRVVDILTFLPHAIPGIVIGVALMWAYLIIPLPIYGTIWILLVAYVTNRIAFGTRVMNAAMVQLHKELEEASYASGGSWLRTFVRITLPLLRPAFVNGWVFSAIAVAKAMGSVIMIYSPESIVLPVLVWEFWNEGDVPATAAIGVMLIVVLVSITFMGRKYGAQALAR